MPGDRGRLRAMRLLPFAAATDSALSRWVVFLRSSHPVFPCRRGLPFFREQSNYALSRQDTTRWADPGTYRAQSSAHSQPGGLVAAPSSSIGPTPGCATASGLAVTEAASSSRSQLDADCQGGGMSDLGCTVRRCPLASTAVGDDCYSLGYSVARESVSRAVA